MTATLKARLVHTALGPVAVIWAFGYVLVDIVAYLTGRTEPGTNLISSVPMFALGVGQTLALDALRQKLVRQSWIVRWATLGVAVAAATAIQALFDLYWLRFLSLTVFLGWQEWALTISIQRLFTVGILYLWTFCLALTLLWAARSSARFEASSARAARAEAAAARAEAAALRLQLNPHFLFNTLNSISSLVQLDRKGEADEMIDRLCEFLRSSLGADPMADVPLAEEIETIDAYLAIEAARFGDRLTISIDIPPDAAEERVPNFILQPLVENAIKHGAAKTSQPATLDIEASRDEGSLLISVANSISGTTTPPEPPRASTGIGLSNIRQRLANRFGAAASLDAGETPGGYRAVIRLPLSPRPLAGDGESIAGGFFRTWRRPRAGLSRQY